ncbi:MAG: sulfotransferase domain-containing protein [Candidatus Aminicenantes bacterium]|nr:sulfotransferase domain-containing protein [Candidatus Aminicenantes bacterium]
MKFTKIARMAFPRRAFVSHSIPDLPRVIINSFPKSGTHLLGRLVENLGFIDLPIMLVEDFCVDFNKRGDWHTWKPIVDSGITEFSNPSRKPESTEISLRRIRNGQFCTSHLKYSKFSSLSLKYLKIKHLFIIRDIRDCIISQERWRRDLKAHDFLPKWFFYLNALKSDEERLLTVIEGKDRFLEPYSYHLDYGWGWLDDSNVLIVRYENLIGPKGGGTVNKQKEEIKMVANYLGCKRSDKDIEQMANNLWGSKTRTMKYGKSKYWKDKFTPEVNESFHKHYDHYMKKLGYTQELSR